LEDRLSHSRFPPPARQVLANKTLAITGTTGFLGKVLLAKLLRTAPEIRRVYVLIRGESAAHARQRLETEIFSSKLFAEMDVRHKIQAVQADISLPRLGLSAHDERRLLKEVDLIVNAAASTDFMDPIDKALLTNTLPVEKWIHFIKQSGKARLVHVSTCHVAENRNGKVREEIVSTETERHAETLQRLKLLASQMNDPAESAEAGLRFAKSHGQHNIHTLTKWLGEMLLAEERDRMHCTVVRPSIIEGCWRDPVPGWIEGCKVADPLIYAAGRDKDAVFDVIPVDLVANAIILALAELAVQEFPTLNVYQSCSSADNPLTLSEMLDFSRASFIRRGGTIQSALSLAATLVPPLRKNSRGRDRSPYAFTTTVFDNLALRELHGLAHPADRLALPVSARLVHWRDYLGEREHKAA
jgi:nucleoside-diphosphate-sugar epimerase